jgi:predicted transcriptional regulator of viral defense system
MQTNIDKIQEIILQRGIVTSADIRKLGFSPKQLCYMKAKGILRRISRGVYTLSGHVTANETFTEIALKIPHGVICLFSALQYHELTTQMPYESWVAIEKNSYYPRSLKPSVKIIQLTGKIFSSGIETHTDNGVSIKVYCPAKTVVDCFRFRNKIGIDIAIEAMRDVLSQKKAAYDEIWEYARICRMTKVMRPYLEAIQ